MMKYSIFPTQHCDIIIAGSSEEVTMIQLIVDDTLDIDIPQNWIRDDEEFDLARTEITEYLNGRRQKFTITVAPQGTKFQKQVWKALQDIPYGETRTYKEIATAIGNPAASRAVGAANGKNPVPLLIPCHRVIGADGTLTGFAYGLDIKEKLLQLEKDTL